MGGPNVYNPPWNPPSLTTDDATSYPNTAQKYGASPPLSGYQPRTADTMTSATHGQIQHPQLSPLSPNPLTHIQSSHPAGNAASLNQFRNHQSSVVSPTLQDDLTHTGMGHHPSASERQWVDGANGGHHPIPLNQPQTYNNIPSSSHAHGRRPSNGPPDASTKKCGIPDCTYNAYYDVAEQEQTEYCGQGHELQAIATGLAASCVMCKGRPRRTGERVCGRTCRERERQARQVQGSYYGVPVSRREPRTRPGA